MTKRKFKLPIISYIWNNLLLTFLYVFFFAFITILTPIFLLIAGLVLIVCLIIVAELTFIILFFEEAHNAIFPNKKLKNTQISDITEH